MTKKVASFYDAVEKAKRIRCFMDGIDWQEHLGRDTGGAELFPSPESTRKGRKCLAAGGRCGIVEVEVRLVRWVEEQNLHAEINAAPQVPAMATSGTEGEIAANGGEVASPHPADTPAVAAPDGDEQP